jgi:hypothetical protein
MEKRGVSKIMTTVLLVVIAIILVFSIYPIVRDYSAGKLQIKFNCIQDADIDILNACYEDNLLKIEVKNKNDIILGDFFLVILYFETGISEEVPTPYNTYVMPYETKIITMVYYEGTEKIKVVPRIEEQSYLCREAAPEFEDIEECEND